jgi:UDPglucose 6-dehydrogenase
MKKNKISIIGIGKLGLPLALCFQKSGIDVAVYDIDHERVKEIKNNTFKTDEKDVNDLLLKFSDDITFSQSTQELVDFSETFIVLVNTQINETYSSINVAAVIDDLVNDLTDNSKIYKIIISSTIMPGDINSKIKPILDKVEPKIELYYIPDFVKLGSVIYDFENPDFLIIGNENTNTSIDYVENIYKTLIKNNAPIRKLSMGEAELAKLAFNTYYLTKLSFVNMLSNICNKLDDTNVDSITNAIGPDPRINNGTKFFKGGTAFGGTCLHRDINAFIQFADSVGIDSGLIKEAENINSFQNILLSDYISKEASSGDKVGVYGLTFKPDTDVITHSASIEVIKNLENKDIEIAIFDNSKIAINKAKDLFLDNITECESLEMLVSSSDVIVLMHLGQNLTKLNPKLLKDKIFIDPWRNIEKSSDYKVVYLGKTLLKD